MSSRRPFAAGAVVAAITAAAIVVAPVAQAQEPAACLSPDPAQWPAPKKPYFMIAFDTSGSMGNNVTGSATDSCGWGTTRLTHGKCALRNTILAYSGQVNFGLMTYARLMTGCNSNCYAACDFANVSNNRNSDGCGPEPNCGLPNSGCRAGGLIRVPMLQDTTPPGTSNVPALLSWVDNNCTNSIELFAAGNTPINGVIRDAFRYYSNQWTPPSPNPGGATLTSPLTSVANGERDCRSVNVILLTDGDETCDSDPADPNDAIRDLYGGFTKDGITWHVRTHVINFAGGDTTKCNQFADLGDDGIDNNSRNAFLATNETSLAQGLSNIIAGTVRPEVCDNVDNNCNDCTDEGYNHYCNVGQTCCSADRTTCLTNYQNSITPLSPSGDLTLLPCTTVAQKSQPANWLCYDPKEICDNVDNNCVAGIDETVTKCGNPLHCPVAETCNGQDDDCDGITDEGVCSGCTPTAEVCDGCDNDCDGVADDGIAPVSCGFSPPANCAGTMTCTAKSVSTPGACVAGGWNACSNNPQTEVCDSIDNDCDGIVDDGIAPVTCLPAGTPAGLVYGGTSQCRRGTLSCGGTCTGFVGPSAEICDGIDNDCDGTVDETAFGVGQPCGLNQPPCTPGTTACVNAVIVCQGGTQPQPEICDGVDNNCNGSTDEAPLADGPASSSNGCWTNPGSCCSFDGLSWCPPAGATCSGIGSLRAPCTRGTLACAAGAWACQGSKGPSAEVCDGADNNCDGTVDNAVPQVGQTCGTNTGECTAGVYACTNGALVCPGETGPKPEECNGLDDDCDGQVDEGVAGIGVACGNSTPPCSPGVTACVNGQVICRGGKLPQAEQCDGIDNDCDGVVDDAPLSDAPAAGQTGCWSLPGNCCTHDNFSWCPPTGATCAGQGTLTPPCGAGVLRCTSGAWGCSGAQGPGTETCDGIDNDCNGAIDNVPPVPCVPPGTPSTLVYGGTSQCKRGQRGCGACAGFVGPTNEICDGIDNDCDGTVDEGAIGTNQDCGVSNPPCTLGKTACVNGVLACQGGVQPEPEICDGIDNDCNGTADDGSLLDAPPANAKGCWNNPGNCCKFGSLSWCAPTGATCNDNGTLAPPCNKGFLTCAGTNGWNCLNPRGPSPEVCDGIDNNCNASIDDGDMPGIGDACGQNIGECKEGTLACANGVLDCVGDVPPTDEVCDGLDNNCNGVNDDGVSTGGPCAMKYDEQLYPGNRDQGACQLGVAECDGNGGIQCEGGIGPSPEICDGIDNDCDGTVDETGSAPDGIDGTDNPTGTPAAKIGDACGASEGVCEPGAWRCRYGMFACLGGVVGELEQCDCSDNDCNGQIDNQNPPGQPPLCGEGKACVKFGNDCQCAAPCAGGEFPCGGGQQCKDVTSSNTGADLGKYCIMLQDLCVGGCADKTVKDAHDNVLCAPAGTDPPGCQTTPVCKCIDGVGCQEPCFNKNCADGEVCAMFGANAGNCVTDTCFLAGCSGCDQVCNAGGCVENPCKSDTCAADEVCQPKDNFTAFDCVGSCAGVTCDSNQKCRGGVCVAWCEPPCATGDVCDPTTLTCVTDKCATAIVCSDGSCCDPLVGGCGNCPCEGVVCPADQQCQQGECVAGTGGAAGTGGSAGTGGLGGAGGSGGVDAGPAGSGGTGAQGGGPAQDAAPSPELDDRVWGLATGGGGCQCRLGSSSPADHGKNLLLAGALVLAAFARRRSGRKGGAR